MSHDCLFILAFCPFTVVACWSQKLSGELSGLPGSLVAVHCDLNESQQIETLFATVVQQFGGVDVCVNNAGVSFAGSLLDGDVEKWRTILNVNVLAAAHCAKLAVRSMADRNVDEGQVRTAGGQCIWYIHTSLSDLSSGEDQFP